MRSRPLLTLENGKPLAESLDEVETVIRNFEYYGGWADKVDGRVLRVPEGALEYLVHEPLGVVGHIIPWNYPIDIFARGVAPSLAVGNTVVVKPSEETPLGALMLAALAVDAGIPPGVVNVVSGFGSDAGAHLANHPGIQGLAFCGSVATGTRGAARRRTPDHAGRLARARRQGGGDRVRGRGSRGSGNRRRLRHRAQRGSVLRRPLSGARPAPARRRDGRADPGRNGGDARGARAGRPGHGAARIRSPAGAGPGVHRVRAGRGRPGRPRRRPAPGHGRRPGLLRGANAVRRCQTGHAHRPGGDLRAGRVAAAVRRRGGGRRDCERHRLRLVDGDLDPGPVPGTPGRRPTRCQPRHDQRQRRVRDRNRRSAESRTAGSAARAATNRSSSTRGSRPSGSTSAPGDRDKWNGPAVWT